MPTLSPVDIGEAIKAARKAAGMTQDELYEAVIADGGAETVVKQSVISRWENGHRRVQLEDIMTLERSLGLPRGRLLIEAGYVEGIETVDQAIAADRALDESAKESLRNAYAGLMLLSDRQKAKG